MDHTRISGAPANSNDQLSVSVEEASRRTGLGRTTLYDLMGDGTLPYVKLGGRRLLMVDDLRALLASHRQTARAA